MKLYNDEVFEILYLNIEDAIKDLNRLDQVVADEDYHANDEVVLYIKESCLAFLVISE